LFTGTSTGSHSVPPAWRSVDRREHRRIAADLDRAGRIAGVLREDRRRRLDQRAAQALGEMHAAALHVGAGGLPHRERLGVVAELDADFLQHRVGIGLDEGKAFLVEHLIDLDAPADVGQLRRRPTARACCAPRTASAPATGLFLDCCGDIVGHLNLCCPSVAGPELRSPDS
jgi:hypothetical protein